MIAVGSVWLSLFQGFKSGQMGRFGGPFTSAVDSVPLFVGQF